MYTTIAFCACWMHDCDTQDTYVSARYMGLSVAFMAVPCSPSLQRTYLDLLPTWLTAVEGMPWAMHILKQSLEALCKTYSTAQGLQDSFPLAATGIVELSAKMAAVLQHMASAPAAPGSGTSAVFRSGCARLCMQLRDAFLP